MVANRTNDSDDLLQASARLQEACANARFMRQLLAQRSKVHRQEIVQQSRERIRQSRALLMKTASAARRID